MRAPLAVVVALGVSTACASSSLDSRLAGFETRAGVADEELDALEIRVAAFERSVGVVLDLYERAVHELATAETEYRRAGGIARDTGASHARAAREYEAAAANWRLVTLMILSAASWDYAGHLCATRMTTAEYRRGLRRQGIELDGLDADHGLPKSLGGADHPLNYEMIDSSLNRSLGNDLMRKLMLHPIHVLQGSLVSAFMRLRCSPQL